MARTTTLPTPPAPPLSRDPRASSGGSEAENHLQVRVDHRGDGTPVADAVRAFAGGVRPTSLGAWREVSRTGALPGDPDPDSTAAGLVRRWHQHLAVAIDLPMERLEPGADRLPELVRAWLDLARRTESVRRHVALTSGPRAAAEAERQARLLAGLLAEDLALMGAPAPLRSAHDLLVELAAVAAAEDAVGRPLRDARRSLLGAEPAPRPCLLERLARILQRPATA